MSNQSALDQLKKALFEVVATNELLKVTLGSYQGNDKLLKNIYVKKVKIKRVEKLSFTYRYTTRDIIKNLDIPDAIDLIINFTSNDFRICNVFCVSKEIFVEHNAKGSIVLKERLKASDVKPSMTHDKAKHRAIVPAASKRYLQDLRITDQENRVYKNAQDKFRQINHYIEILSPLIAALPVEKPKRVVDMGSGKGYLTFALYDYLSNLLGLETSVTGVEYREDLVTLCNEIAAKSGFSNLKFQQGSIEDFKQDDLNILIALHACDTATDDAIFKGIRGNASLIVVAPCCHKQIRKEMEASTMVNQLAFLTKHGIFLERQAEMVTDGIRALVLQYFGYKTKVMQFVSDIHTPKNVMIVGVKTGDTDVSHQQKRLKEIKSSMDFFDIRQHHLVKLFEL